MAKTLTIEDRFIEALRRLRARTDHLEEMATWKEDLAARLWRATMVMRMCGQPLYDVRQLEHEVKMYGEICAKLQEKRDHPKVDEGDKAL